MMEKPRLVVSVTNARLEVDNARKSVAMRAAIRATKVKKQGHEHTEPGKKGWSGWLTLGNQYKNHYTFPVGLVPRVLYALELEGIRPVIETLREKPLPCAPPAQGLQGVTLRDYQTEMVDSIVKQGNGHVVYRLEEPRASLFASRLVKETGEPDPPLRVAGMGVWWSATGSGKTEAAAGLIGALAVPTVFLVYGNHLVTQTFNRFQGRLGRWLSDHDLSLGIIVEGEFNPGFITVASSSTLDAMLARRGRLKKKALKYVVDIASLCNTKTDPISPELAQLVEDWREKFLRAVGSKSVKRIAEAMAFLEEHDKDEVIPKRRTEAYEFLVGLPEKWQRASERKDKAEKWLSEQGLLILDEAHGGAASTVYSILRACPAFYRVAMSGTPLDRSDSENLRIIANFGEVVHRVTNKQMMDAGVIPPTTIHVERITEMVHMWEGYKWEDLYEEGIVYHYQRNKKIIQRILWAIEQGKSVLAIYRRIVHGEILSALLSCDVDNKVLPPSLKPIIEEVLEGVPIPHEMLNQDNSLAEREAAIDRIEGRLNHVLLASEIFGTGLDLPDIGCLINVSGSRAVIPVKQRIGRGLRGDEHMDVIEFADGQHYRLAQHAYERLMIYNDEDCFEILDVKE